MEIYNLEDVRAFIDLLHPRGNVFEIRLIGDRAYSGYFDNVDVAIAALQRNEALLVNNNCYITLNPVKSDSMGRKQANKILISTKGVNTTSDNEIEKRNYILLDIDTKNKIAGVNATDEEKANNHKFAQILFKELKRRGIYTQIIADSGNGYHLYIPVDLDNTSDNTTLIKDFLNSVNSYVSIDSVFGDLYLKSEVDLKVFNASRIVKLIGTWSRKGNNAYSDRPQRLSQILHVDTKVEVNKQELLLKFIKDYKLETEVRPNTKYSNMNKYFDNNRFDMEKFITSHGIQIYKTKDLSWGKGYILEECLFDSSHKRDAMLTQNNDGAVGYFCFHNSCSNNHWLEVKKMFNLDTNSYQKNYKPIGYQPKVINVEIPKSAEATEEVLQWNQLSTIKEEDWTNCMLIPTGIETFDKETGGLKEHELTVITATTSSGKTNLVLQIGLNAVDNGHKVGIFSGEQTNSEIADWIYRIAAGKVNIHEKTIGQFTFYNVYDNTKKQISDWAENKLFIYNTDYKEIRNEDGKDVRVSRVDTIIKGIIDKVDKEGLSLVILDNLMVLDSEFSVNEKYSGQKELVFKLEELVKAYKLHIILIAHPRKTYDYLTLFDVSGSADIVNTAQNVLIFHRCTEHWRRKAHEVLPTDVYEDIEQNSKGNMLEIAKNRSRGRRDVYIPLFFEPESKRFKEHIDDVITFGFERPSLQDMSLQSSNFSSFTPNTNFDNPQPVNVDWFGESNEYETF